MIAAVNFELRLLARHSRRGHFLRGTDGKPGSKPTRRPCVRPVPAQPEFCHSLANYAVRLSGA